MMQPASFEYKAYSDLVSTLTKALHGLKETLRAWY